MAFEGSFTLTKTPALGLNYGYVTDDSDYTDQPKSDFSDRYFYLIRPDGTYVQSPGYWDNVAGAKPSMTITVDSVPPDGFGIQIWVPWLAFLDLGYYLKNSSDTNTTILATHIAAALSGPDFTITSQNNVVTIVYDVETDEYNGESFFYPSDDIPTTKTLLEGGVDASSTFIDTPTDRWGFNFTNYPDDEIEIEAIDEDMAVNIKMYWIPDTVDPASTYELSTAFDFLDNFNLWGYNMVLSMAANPSLAQNKNFLQGIFAADALASASNLSIENEDAYSSQQCIDGIDYIINNPNVLY
jgi:hypothetical protein